ncbi:unnamed protein product [Urochloa decumbens]|uniref:DUF7595 domain-containing protein n=1 Tax=Urochloa decumbens TaxID=240449 RepID=A0ABC9H9B0_9POAL
MSSGTGAAAAERVPGPDLTEDAIAEILARVQQPPDVAFLFRCAFVCKLWCRVLADPAFLRRLLPAESGRSSLLGFIAGRLPVGAEQQIPLLPAFVPAPGSALGPGGHRSLASFVRDDAGVLDRAEPLAAHDGFLLLRVSPRPAADRNVLRLCVCNLLTGRLHVLPPLLNTALFDANGVRGYAVLSAADNPSDGYSTSFQVLLIAVHHGDNQLYLHRFSSSAGNWIATPTNFFLHDRSWRAPITNDSFRQFLSADSFQQRQRHFSDGCRAATVCCGAVHWLFEYGGNLYIHHVSLKTWQLGTTRVLIDVMINWCNARLCSSAAFDGRLSFVYVSNDNLVIWTQRDRVPDYNFGWELDEVITVNIMERRRSRTHSLATACFGQRSGTVFVIYDSDPDSACLLDLRSRFPSQTMTKVMGWNESLNDVTAVPYEVNWPRFFMSRLGTRT